MSDRTSDEVIALAQQEVAARQAQRAAADVARDRSWRAAFIGLGAVLLLALLLWPSMPLNWKMYAVVHGVCAQIHNVELGGVQLPLCARNTGIYSSFLLTTLVLLVIGRARAVRLPPLPITITLLLFVGVMAVDGFNSLFRDLFLPHLYTPRNDLRTLTGIGMGITMAVFMLLVINMSLRDDPDEQQPIIAGWHELAGVLGLNALVLVAMYGNLGFMYWPIAIIAWSGIVGILFAVNVLVIALMLGYERRIAHLTQLARPAMIALVTTSVMLGGMAWMRFWLEANGLMVN
ncbi:MAG TPA: DUF2085 domain-containing protein [Roseiflexaceae bacterium]|nr:DUF2085 domain-containing protein [Roseiflexaceae bacterium]HMP39965.1 DUF2085 domain-containing protein [Roseiflexaceae bacterium]